MTTTSIFVSLCGLFCSLSALSLSSDTPSNSPYTSDAIPSTAATGHGSITSTQMSTYGDHESNMSAEMSTDGTDDPADGRADDERIPLYLSAFFSLGGSWDGSGILPAVEMALDHINENPNVLPGYVLRMIWNDTQCDAGLGTRMLFDQLNQKPQKIMILGPACSTAAQSVAETAYHWNLVTMSYSAASSALSDREKYPYFYRTYMPDAAFNPARVRLMKDFGWNRVATIHYNHELFSLAIDDLLTLLTEANITIITSESFAVNPKNQVENIKAQDAKIIVANMYENMARRVFCEAYKQGMTGDDYVWLLIGWYAHEWWAREDDFIDCTTKEMTEAVLGSMYISTEPLQLSTKDEPIISGITPAQYIDFLEERMEWEENSKYTWNHLSPFGYDAAWAIAHMLNKSIDVLKHSNFSDGKQRRLEDFTYDDSEMAKIFFKLLKETDFEGATGPVSFRDGDRVGVTQVEQLQAVCDEDWYLFDGYCYHFAFDALDFEQAEEDCGNMSAHLATISNLEENMFVYGTWLNFSENNRPTQWTIGLKYSSNKGDFTWVDLDNTDQDLMWQPVGSLLPLTGNSEGDCVHIDFTDSTWHVSRCTDALPYICRKKGDFSEQRVALYTTKGDIMDWEKPIIWRGGKIPLDHTPSIVIIIERIHQGIYWYLYVAMFLAAGMGISIALFFLVFNIMYRNQRFVKLSSPNLNNLIILGSICVYLSIFAGGIDDEEVASADVHAVACQVRAWVLSVGFVLAFGSMFSKTWRVHRVAAFKTPKRRIITDNQLFAMVFIFFLIDICILTAWQIFDPMFVQVNDLLERDDPNEPNHRIIPYINQCTCHHLIYWLVPLYSYKGLLLLFGTFLAWETRRVTIPALNDSKLIGICVYNVIVLCIVGVSVSFLISNNPSALFIFTSSIVIFCTTLTLVVVFLPKVISVYKYPEGEPVSTVKGRMNTAQFDSQETSTSNSLREENKQLRDRIQVLKKECGSNSSGSSSSSDSLSSHKVLAGSGCGFWMGQVVCACCSAQPIDRRTTYRVEKMSSEMGKDNPAMEMET